MEHLVIENLRRAYTNAYAAGATLPSVERQILIAAITDSARAAADRLTLMGVDKRRIDETIQPLVDAIGRENKIGGAFDVIGGIAKKAGSDAFNGALSVFVTAGVAGVAAAVVGILARVTGAFGALATAISDAGHAVGYVAAVGFGLVPGYLLFRWLPQLAKSIHESSVGSTNPVTAIWGSADALGRGADAILDNHLRPAEAALFNAGSPPSKAFPERMRTLARFSAGVALIASFLAALLFLSGVLEGVDAVRANPND